MNMFNQEPESCLTRNPTRQELDLFIDRVLKEKDETSMTMFQAIVYKLKMQPHSLPEGEIYPMVLERLQQRFGK